MAKPWIIGVVLLGAALPGPAGAAELRVGHGHHATVTAAIQAAKPGDTIRISSGTYRERLVLAKPLTLLGEGWPTLEGGGTGDVIALMAPGCRVQGLHVTHGGREILSENAGIKLLSDRNIVENNRIDRCLYGLYAVSSHHNQLRNNTVLGLSLAELPTHSVNDLGDGIRLHESHHNTVSGNQIDRTRDGVYFSGSSWNVIEGNAISKVRYGLHYMSSDDNMFANNRFTEAEAGSALMFSRRISLHHNLFTGNRGYRAFGILIKECEDSTMSENVIAGNRVGAFFDGAINDTIVDNEIVGNDVGLEVRANSETNRFERNTIAGNSDAIALPTGECENVWEGNYWSDYRGYDLDGDGRGDVPHQAGSVFSYLTENYPPVRLFLLSPAIHALEFAERTFPVLSSPQVKDEAPLVRPLPGPKLLETPSRTGKSHVSFLMVSCLVLLAGLLPLLNARKAFHS